VATVRMSLEEVDRRAAQEDPETRARFHAITEEEIERGAASDPDNPLLSEDMLDRLEAASLARRARERVGLSQQRFAARFRINLARLRDLERGRYAPDSALVAYLRVIACEPETVDRILQDEPA